MTIHGVEHNIFVLHGTPKDRLASIKREGLRATAEKQYDISEGLHVTQYPHIAQRFAAEKVHVPDSSFLAAFIPPTIHDGSILKLALSEDEARAFEVDQMWDGNITDPFKAAAVCRDCTVSPEHIVGEAQYHKRSNRWVGLTKMFDGMEIDSEEIARNKVRVTEALAYERKA